MPFPLAAGGLVLGAANQIGRYFSGVKQNKLANKINPVYTPYEKSPYAEKQLGVANQLFNGRMAGAANMERNIATSQANATSKVNRNATDASQALALNAGIQGQTNDAFMDLQTREAQNKYAMLDNLNRAYGVNINEGDKVYQDKMQKYQLDMQAKNQLRDAAMNNKYGAVNDLASLGIMGGQLMKGGVATQQKPQGAMPTIQNMPTANAPLLFPIGQTSAMQQQQPYNPNVPLNPNMANQNPYGQGMFPILGNTPINPFTGRPY